MKRFLDKVVIITGAGRGMGKTCGISFAKEGAAVAFVDNKIEGIQEISKKILKEGGRAIAILCDVSKANDVKFAVDRVLAEFGTVDILVNNAGILFTTSPLTEITEKEWDLVINVNLKGIFLFSKSVLPIMQKKCYGKIINISSSAGRSTSELGGAHYTASKAGVLGFTRHTAREYGRYNINVNSICPGLVETSMIRENAEQEKLDYWLSQIPLGRFADSTEEADLVLFLASKQAKYITGAAIDFNGGSLLL